MAGRGQRLVPGEEGGDDDASNDEQEALADRNGTGLVYSKLLKWYCWPVINSFTVAEVHLGV